MIPVKQYNKKIENISNKIERLNKSVLGKNPFTYESIVEPKILLLEEKRKKLQQITADLITGERARLGEKGFYLTDDGTVIALSVKTFFDIKQIKPIEENCEKFRFDRLLDRKFDKQEKLAYYVPTVLGAMYIMDAQKNLSKKNDFKV